MTGDVNAITSHSPLNSLVKSHLWSLINFNDCVPKKRGAGNLDDTIAKKWDIKYDKNRYMDLNFYCDVSWQIIFYQRVYGVTF